MIAILRLQTLHTITAVAAAAVVAGCNGTPAPASPIASAPSAAALSSAPLVGPRIVGTVVLASTGKPPATGGVVYLEDGPKQPGVAMTATIDVHNKEFTPFLSVITTGGTVTFGNKDALTHHVFSPDVQEWDTGYLRKNETAARTFASPAAIALLCNIHPEMLGYLVVIPSTYFGKLGADGHYAIAKVPPGTYKVTVWLPRTPTATRSVTVGPTGAATADFELPPAGPTN
jgi:plastocyanin